MALQGLSLMNACFPLRAVAVWLSGIGLVLVGLLGVLYFIGLFLWQYSTALKAGAWVPLPATLWFVDHSLVQGRNIAPVLEFIPNFPSTWVMNPERWLPVHKAVTWGLNRLHVGFVFAVLGALIMTVGALIAVRQMAVFTAERRRRQDRLRRVQEYRKLGALTEPLTSGESYRVSDRVSEVSSGRFGSTVTRSRTGSGRKGHAWIADSEKRRLQR